MQKRVVDILEEQLGGKWRLAGVMDRWFSDDFDFAVYRSSKWDGRTAHMVYRRTDTNEVVYYPRERNKGDD